MKTTINKKLRGIAAALLLIGLVPSNMMAQDKVEASVGADLVSGYIWRGQDLGGVSIQPSLGISYKGLSLGAWGSVGFESSDTKEFDLTLGYSTGGFSISVTDYWFNTQVPTNKYFKYGAHSTAHVFEAQVGYDFGPLAINWYTNFAGADGVKENGKRAYSSYLALSAPFSLGGLDWTVDVGMVPWETTFYNGYTSGYAFTKSYVGYVHAIAHSLGGEYNVPHGLANAVILPMVLESYGESIYTKLHDLAIAAGVADKDMPDETAAKAFIQAVKDMKARFNIGDTIPEIKEEDIPKLAGYADKEANPLYPVPVLMDAKTLEQFYYKLMKDNTRENEV